MPTMMTHPQSFALVLGIVSKNHYILQNELGDRYLAIVANKSVDATLIRRRSFVITKRVLKNGVLYVRIVKSLNEKDILYYNKRGMWPAAFASAVPKKSNRYLFSYYYYYFYSDSMSIILFVLQKKLKT